MEKKKNYSLFIIGTVIVIISIVSALYTHGHSYMRSVEFGKQLTEVKNQISAIESGSATGDLASLNSLKTTLSDSKLKDERPYSYSLAFLFLGVMIFVKGIYNAFFGTATSQKADVTKLAQAGLLAALCYIGFAVFKIDIPVGTEKTSFHFGNVFCVLSALLLGGYIGGLSGAIGMTFGDLTTSYVTSAPKTFILKLLIGLITGFVAHKIFKLSDKHSSKYVTGVTILASACGMGFNIIADPVVGYFYKTYLLGVPQDLAATLAKLNLLTTSVNAVVAVIAATIFYLALRPALKKAGLFVQVTPESTN